MRVLRVVGGMLLLWLVFLTSPAYPWGFAVHAHLADRLNKPDGDRNLNEMYGAMAPDMFNFRFDLPVYGDGKIYFQLHYYWENIWEPQKTGMEKALGYGFITHNDHWGADAIAHHAGITYGTDEGYVIAKAQDLLQANPSLLLFVDEPTALELTHTFVEYGLEILSKRMDPEIGQKVTQAAFYRSPRFPSMLAKAYAPSFAPLFGNDPDLAEQAIVSNEAEFRQQTMLYGQLLMLDEPDLTWALSEQLAQFTDAYGVKLPSGVDPTAVIHIYLQQAVQLCQDDFAAELDATFEYLEAAMPAHNVGNRQ